METYRVGIVGCRARGTHIARAYHAHARAEVVGLADLLPERLEELGTELGVEARFTDLDEMIEATQPELVVVATGTELHFDLALRVLDHGVHLDIEKPLCPELAQGDAVVAHARQQGVRVACHHQGRVGGAMRAVWAAYQAGRIGKLLHLSASGKGYYAGYGLMNIGTHLLNSLLKFGGVCREVRAVGQAAGRPVLPTDVMPAPGGMGLIIGEHLDALLRFDDGLTAYLRHHRFPRLDSTAYGIILYGTEGMLMWKSQAGYLLPQPHWVPDGEHDQWEVLPAVRPEGVELNDKVGLDDYWYADEYLTALDQGRDHECSGRTAVQVLEIMMAVFESAAYSEPVWLPQSRRDHPLYRLRAEHRLDPLPEMPRDYGQWLAAEDRRLGRTGG